MKRSHIIVLLLIALGLWVLWVENPRQYIKRTTGISLPKGTTIIDSYDNGEHYIVSFLVIPKELISTFVSTHTFIQVGASDRSVFGSEKLKPEHQQLSKSAILYSLEYNHWQALLDYSTGEMLLSIRYPDYAGDNP